MKTDEELNQQLATTGLQWWIRITILDEMMKLVKQNITDPNEFNSLINKRLLRDLTAQAQPIWSDMLKSIAKILSELPKDSPGETKSI